jgi:G6PDH family F420-dependent oxidoreductase
MSGFGDAAARMAGRLADGFICTMPDAEFVRTFRVSGGEGRPSQGAVKVCYAADREQAVKTVYRLWPNALIPGEAAQLLPLPRHFAQLSELVTEEMVGESMPCGPDVETHVRAIKAYVDAGYDEVYVNQIGPDQQAFFDFYRDEVLPRVRAS